MNRERLELMIEVLEGVDPRHFNIRSWHMDAHDHFDSPEDPNTGNERFCAVGHAANDPRFQEMGLGWTRAQGSNRKIIPSTSDGSSLHDFFGITGGEFSRLFLPENYRRKYTDPESLEQYTLQMSRIEPKHVIAEIRMMLDEDAKAAAPN